MYKFTLGSNGTPEWTEEEKEKLNALKLEGDWLFTKSVRYSRITYFARPDGQAWVIPAEAFTIEGLISNLI